MSKNLLIQNINNHVNLSDDEAELLMSLMESKIIKARKLFLREGDISTHFAFVTNGCMRSYSVDNNGFEHVLAFAPSGWWIGDLYSLISKKGGILNIEAIEDTKLLLLSKENQNLLFEKIPKFERFFRILAENSLVAYHERTIDNLSHSAAERYERFCYIYPQLIKSLPQKHIAAYIGVTPEFFSKMRSHFLKTQKK